MNNRVGLHRLYLTVALALTSPLALATVLDSISVNGNVGYNYRSFSKKADGSSSSSNQVVGSLSASSYLWRPWFANVDGAITAAHDKGKYNNGAGDSSDIVTGEINLNLFPDGHTPFSLRYQVEDSKVDSFRLSDAPLTLGGVEFQTQRLELRQSWLAENGGRYLARYDASTWKSDTSGDYEDAVVGVEADTRWEKNHVLAKASYGTVDYQPAKRQETNLVVDVNHFYNPYAAFRLDTKASYYQRDRNVDPTAGSTKVLGDSRSSNYDMSQVSSFAFYRPDNSPYTVSGGLRVAGLNGGSDLSSSDLTSISGQVGGYYKYSERLRFDASGAVTWSDSNKINLTVSREHLGTLFQSELHDFSGLTWDWYSTGGFDNQTDGNSSLQQLNGGLGHSGNKTWMVDDDSSIRLSLGQVLTGGVPSKGDSTLRLDHTGTASWARTGDNGASSYAQFTVSDTHNVVGDSDDQQLANIQFTRNQPVSRASYLTGNLTLQYVRQNFVASGGDTTVVTATGRIDYQHAALFGVSQLRFLSSFYVSRAASQEQLDRAEWENRIDYHIGLTDTGVSLRALENDGDFARLVQFYVSRRF